MKHTKELQSKGVGLKFSIGQRLWLASFDAVTNHVVCPDCGGTGRVRVIHHDETMLSIECAGCQSGYDKPSGYVKVYDRKGKATEVIVTGIEMEKGQPRYRTDKSYFVEDADLFETEADCIARAQEKAAEYDAEERAKVAAKEKPTRTWSWNAHYHRREIKEAKRRLEYHTSKLAVASIKAKEDRRALNPKDET